MAFVCSGSPAEIREQLRMRSANVDRLALSLFATDEARVALLEELRQP